MEFKGPESIKIRRISRPGYFGINSYPKSVTTLCCEMSSKGYFKTGLTKEEEAYFEDKLKLKPGDLDKHSKWWTSTFNVEHALRLNNTKATELILDNPMSQLKYKVALASSKIANSEIERTPNAIFYIDNAEAKAQAENETMNYELEGMKMILSYTPEEKRSNLRLFGKAGLDSMAESVLNSQLYLLLKADPKKFIDTLTDKDVKTKGLIQELVEKNIITRKGNYFMHGEDTIAHSTEECVSYLNDPKNAPVRLVLESRLNKTKKGK